METSSAFSIKDMIEIVNLLVSRYFSGKYPLDMAGAETRLQEASF